MADRDSNAQSCANKDMGLWLDREEVGRIGSTQQLSSQSLVLRTPSSLDHGDKTGWLIQTFLANTLLYAQAARPSRRSVHLCSLHFFLRS